MKYTLIIFIALIVLSCSQKQKEQKQSYNYHLETNKTKTLQYSTPYSPLYFATIQPFKDKYGKQFLTIQDHNRSSIVFYEMYSGNHHKTIKIPQDGPNSVSNFVGYYIEDYDKIYVTEAQLPIIYRVDTTGVILEKILYEKTNDGLKLVPNFKSSTLFYTPLVIIGKEFYITQSPMPGKAIDSWPVSCVINTADSTVKALPMTFPPFFDDKERYHLGIGPVLHFSRCFNGTHFLYSFFYEEFIRVASPDHTDVREIPVKSKYISQIDNPRNKRPSDMELGVRKICEVPFYGNLLYDQYREVYYRIAYPETEMEKMEIREYMDIWTTGRKDFSIIILDKDFNIIGETLFKGYKYHSKQLFINENGLYIRSNHFKSPDFDEDVLMFDCLELKKK